MCRGREIEWEVLLLLPLSPKIRRTMGQTFLVELSLPLFPSYPLLRPASDHSALLLWGTHEGKQQRCQRKDIAFLSFPSSPFLPYASWKRALQGALQKLLAAVQ